MSREGRHNPRIPVKCRVKLQHPDVGEIVVDTRDISDTGVYLVADSLQGLSIGTVVKGQVQGMMADAPVLDMEIVRVDQEGIGLRFCDE